MIKSILDTQYQTLQTLKKLEESFEALKAEVLNQKKNTNDFSDFKNLQNTIQNKPIPNPTTQTNIQQNSKISNLKKSDRKSTIVLNKMKIHQSIDP
jgi:hypothetical protein